MSSAALFNINTEPRPEPPQELARRRRRRRRLLAQALLQTVVFVIAILVVGGNLRGYKTHSNGQHNRSLKAIFVAMETYRAEHHVYTDDMSRLELPPQLRSGHDDHYEYLVTDVDADHFLVWAIGVEVSDPERSTWPSIVTAGQIRTISENNDLQPHTKAKARALW